MNPGLLAGRKTLGATLAYRGVNADPRRATEQDHCPYCQRGTTHSVYTTEHTVVLCCRRCKVRHMRLRLAA